MKHNINHLAIIMDGNARWAKQNGVSKAEGHKQGAEAAKALLPKVSELGIPYLTLYAFSSENWKRPVAEVSILIKLLSYYMKSERKLLNDNNIRLKVVGKLDRLDDSLRKSIEHTIESTKNNKKLTVCVAFSYGGREEIVQACQRAIERADKEISVDSFNKYFYDPEMPDVDLLIRTSGVYRISNFLLWQLAYAELYFTKKYWPDFTENDLIEAAEDYSQRQRNFGLR